MSLDESDGLAGVTVDKVGQSLKRGLDGSTVKEHTSRTPAKHHGNQTPTGEASTAPHKSKRKPSVKYNGLSELELSKRHLPDHLVLNLDILIVGLNPSLQSAFKGHHYAGPGHHFWKCIHTSGLVPHAMNACEDYRLPQFGVGFTNVVPRATKSASDLTKEEIREGRAVLIQKIKLYKPKIVVLVGKGVFDIFYSASHFCYGKQSIKFPETDSYVFVIPSATGCGSSYWPRVQDKLPFFQALRKLRDYVKGALPVLREEEVIFPISSSASGSHASSTSGASSATNGTVRKPPNEGRSRNQMTERSGPVTRMSNGRDSVEFRTYASKQGAGSAAPDVTNTFQPANGEATSGTGILNEESGSGQTVVSSSLEASPDGFWSSAPLANSTMVGQINELGDDPALIAAPKDQLEDGADYLSMNGQCNGPVVFHHAPVEPSVVCAPSNDLEMSAVQQVLVFNAPSDPYTKRMMDEPQTCGWPDTNGIWSPFRGCCHCHVNSNEFREPVSERQLAGLSAQPADSCSYDQHGQRSARVDKVWYEWCPANSCRGHCSTLRSGTDDTELTKLYFLDDDFSDSVDHIVGRLIPASEL